MRKVHELAILCNLHIDFLLYDPKINKLVEFATDPTYNLQKLCAMTNNEESANAKSDNRKAFKYKFVNVDEFVESIGNTDNMSKVDGQDVFEWDNYSDAQTEPYERKQNASNQMAM